MADSNQFFKNVEVKTAPRSGFNKSHKNVGTFTVGTITPILWDTLIPNSDATVKIDLTAQLPPLASDTYMRASVKLEAFAVPLRLLYGGFEKYFTGDKVYNAAGDPADVKLPRLNIGSSNNLLNTVGPGTLMDYLGGHYNKDADTSYVVRNPYVNVFPFVAYHKIYDDWYRNSLVQKPLFKQIADADPEMYATKLQDISNLPYYTAVSTLEFNLSSAFEDGVHLVDLRQRNYGCDYFTSATASAQLGPAANVTVAGTSTSGSFSIASLRAANSLQQFRERNSIAGVRLQDFVHAVYGANLTSGVAQRSIYLGSASYTVYSNGIYQTTSDSATAPGTGNPFTSVGAKYGNAYASGSDFYVKVRADEPMILMVNATLVPETNYSSGRDVSLSYFTSADPRGDLANPMLQNIGQQPIYTDELITMDIPGNKNKKVVFGYVDRYADFKCKNNSVHGQMVAVGDEQKLAGYGQLSSFVAQRTLDTYASTNPSISSNFLQIPKTALNNVLATDVASYAWYDSFINYNVVQPLYKYSMPSLQDPAYEHGSDTVIRRGGSRID